MVLKNLWEKNWKEKHKKNKLIKINLKLINYFYLLFQAHFNYLVSWYKN